MYIYIFDSYKIMQISIKYRLLKETAASFISDNFRLICIQTLKFPNVQETTFQNKVSRLKCPVKFRLLLPIFTVQFFEEEQ